MHGRVHRVCFELQPVLFVSDPAPGEQPSPGGCRPQRANHRFPRCPGLFTRGTQKPLSWLWKVTRAVKPARFPQSRVAVTDGGIHVWGFIPSDALPLWRRERMGCTGNLGSASTSRLLDPAAESARHALLRWVNMPPPANENRAWSREMFTLDITGIGLLEAT